MKSNNLTYKTSILRWLASAVLISLAMPVQALESTALKDVIRSNGLGEIDLFNVRDPKRFIDSAVLEAFRQDNNGNLVFAVDVNEAASGTEKAASQGIAIDSVTLTVTIDGNVVTFTDFSTKTTSLLAPKGSTTRQPYYTVIGDTGSNRITGSVDSDINSSSFDSTLTVPVNIDLSSASAVLLTVRFLDVNASLGDPETFYDYSNGYEDVAIVTRNDAAYLDSLAIGHDDAPLVIPADSLASVDTNRLYFPAQDQFYLAAYEDLFPQRGDYDFNDVVVAYRVFLDINANGDVVGISGEGFLIARGAGGYDHDWHLRIALPAATSGTVDVSVTDPVSQTQIQSQTQQGAFTGTLDIRLYSHSKSLWVDGGYALVNTLRQQNFLTGPYFSFNAALDAPVAMTDIANAPFDPYLYVHNTGYEIHLKNKQPVMAGSNNTRDGLSSFIDSNGFPFAMVLPDTWQVPLEDTDLGLAYPDFINFIGSGNIEAPTWYLNADTQRTKATHKTTWKWR